MIDPKLNEIPVDTENQKTLSEEELALRSKQPRSGLSINDTVAANANLSTGSRGVDTSGVRAGSGAGAGSTMVTAGSTGDSPMPNVEPGARGSGTTVMGSRAETSGTSTSPSGTLYEEDLTEEDRRMISARAYDSWCERGCPHGTPEVDWQRALNEHRAAKAR